MRSSVKTGPPIVAELRCTYERGGAACKFYVSFCYLFFFSLSSKTASLPIRHFSRFARADGRVQLRWRGCVLCVVFFTFLSTCKFFFLHFAFCILFLFLLHTRAVVIYFICTAFSARFVRAQRFASAPGKRVHCAWPARDSVGSHDYRTIKNPSPSP